jgi:CO/xanthine dehydrogenase FAD-binding subunit
LSQAFRPKKYLRPTTIEETCELLSSYGDRARILGGGTGIYEVAHRGLLSEVECLIDVTLLGLNQIRVEKSGVRIGAATTMASLMDSAELSKILEFSVLTEALTAIQPLQVKNVATIAGAICTALPFFDLPVALIALDASVSLAPLKRKQKVNEFIQGYFSIDLRQGEFVEEIVLPLARKDEVVGSAFEKFALTGDDWALVNCGARVKLDGDFISEARVCFGGGIGEKPKRALEVEKSLKGARATDENRVRTILDQNVTRDVEAVSDIRGSAEYRTRLAKVLGRRSIVRACKRAMDSAKKNVIT